MTDKEILKKVKEHKEAGSHMLLQTENIAAHTAAVKPMLEEIHFSSDPNDKDVYPDSSYSDYNDSDSDKKTKKIRLAKNGHMKLSIGAGIVWHPTLSGRVDNGMDRHYYAYRVVGAIRRPDGTLYPLSGQYDMDFEVEADKKQLEYDKKRRKWEANKKTKWFNDKSEKEKDEYISDCIRRDILQKRQYKAQLCESGAYNRVVKGILPGLKGAYTVKELEKPFVIVRYIHVPDYSDPEVRRRLVDASIQATLGVYGSPRIENTAITLPPEDFQNIPTDSENADTGTPEQPQGDDDHSDDKQHGDDSGTQRSAFEESGRETQIKLLKEMAALKNYDLNSLLKPFERFSDNQLTEFFDILFDLEDEEIDDDIPF